ncbi:ShlB/FhaC/HecB family hemolysin secretion/activation protein [Coraliomargarita algicola]|uniref:ShlB/FhaC/HecB family hemolysin secretion/activation protein n=1 Tax=Coraliomargarita algicola TaxID=3092156 RepID=A0ABZ0RRD3_9BACT|nr:ShlB/FhaC/HecB family hemolysin secretion/activation protein [Coraliomargarita sp. J2-16]WPJ97540.1 ShlB/FhaC/HecB family hemolysin secretion/activation protein [Coraliomargarita sp. J2-16]
MKPFPNYLLMCACTLNVCVLSVSAQQATVVGPQSVIEQYQAPVVESESGEVLIDFPSMINAPGANDSAQIMPAVARLEIEIVGTSGGQALSEFIQIRGESRAAANRAALYVSLDEALAVYRDLPLTLGDIRFIQQDISDAYKANGYPLMSVVVPPQEIHNGSLKVQINEFRLAGYTTQFADEEGNYSADHSRWSDEARLEKQLNPLLAEPILSQEAFDKKVKAINQNPFRTARVVFEPGQNMGETFANIQIDEQRPWTVQAGYNNHASESSGEDRFFIGGSLGNLPFEDHQLSANATVGTRMNEFENYVVTYTIPNRWGHKLTASFNYSDTASSTIPGIGSASTTMQSTLKYELPVWSHQSVQWNFSALGAYKQFERESLFGSVVVGGAEFDSVQLSLNNTFNIQEATASNQFVVGVVFSFAGLTDNNSDQNFRQFYNSATGEAQTTHYILNYARVQQLGPFISALEGWSTETQLSWQITSDELAGSDNFAIGGANALRAYQSSEVSGDNGFYALQFLHFRPIAGDHLGLFGKWVDQVAASTFIEAGWSDFERGGNARIWDYGLQAQVGLLKNMNVTASFAVAGEDARLTERGDSRFFLSYQFRY